MRSNGYDCATQEVHVGRLAAPAADPVTGDTDFSRLNQSLYSITWQQGPVLFTVPRRPHPGGLRPEPKPGSAHGAG